MSNNKSVGYATPPLKSRFTKGRSGNPKGRPKGSKIRLEKLLEKELNATVTLNDGTKLTKEQCIIKDMVNDAVKGNHKKQQTVFKLKGLAEKTDVSEKFVERLIKEDFITEENVKSFAHRQENLFLKQKQGVITDLYFKKIVQGSTAYEAVKTVTTLSYIYNEIHKVLALQMMHKRVSDEINYWEGAELSLSLTKTPDAEKQKIFQQIASTRKFDRPDEDLDWVSLCLMKNTSDLLNEYILFIRDLLLSHSEYKEQEKDLCGSERKKELLKDGEEELDAEGFDALKIVLAQQDELYQKFMKEKCTRKSLLEVTQEDIKRLFKWYETKKH